MKPSDRHEKQTRRANQWLLFHLQFLLHGQGDERYVNVELPDN